MSTPLTVGTLVSRTVNTWSENLGRFFLVTLVFHVPAAVVAELVPLPVRRANPFAGTTPEEARVMQDFLMSGPFAAALVVMLVLWLLEAAALSFGAMEHLAGRSPSVVSMLLNGLARGAPVVVAGLLGAAAIAVGTFAFVVPGIVVALMLSLVVPVLVAERIGVKDAIRRSLAITKGVRLALFGGFAVILALQFTPILAIRVALAPVPWLSLQLATVASLVLGALLPVGPAVAYHALRGADHARLERVFE